MTISKAMFMKNDKFTINKFNENHFVLSTLEAYFLYLLSIHDMSLRILRRHIDL